MARFYKTPQILKKEKRNSYYTYKNGKPTEKKRRKPIKVDSAETRIQKALELFIIKGEDFTIGQLMRSANVRGTSRYRYEDIYADTIEMIKKYEMNIMQKEDKLPVAAPLQLLLDEKAGVGIKQLTLKEEIGMAMKDPSKISDRVEDALLESAKRRKEYVEVLGEIITKRVFQTILGGTHDTLGSVLFELSKKGIIGEKAFDKAYDVSEKYFILFSTRRSLIHPAFAGKNINEIAELVREKYERVQKLKQEYYELKNQ